MKKGTNTYNKLFELILKLIIPASLVFALIFGGVKSSFNKLLTTSIYMIYPEKTFEYIKKDVNGVKQEINEEYKVGNTVTTMTTVTTNSKLPADIQKLVEDAEKRYENSTNDGEIIEVDYSTQNATAEYNGIYLRNTTLSHSVNIEDVLNKSVQAVVDKDKPTVLIYHTHTSESYELLDRGFYTNERSSRSENSAENMVRIGEEICKTLENNGYKTIHDKTVYDEQYSGAYDRSRENISKILKDNPSIQIVLDIHRDAIYQKNNSRIKPIAEINGTKVAQIMLISGCEDGNVVGFPNWEKNLAFAVQFQEKLVSDNPKLMRPLMFCSRKYNMDLMPCALQIEFGTDANTLSEAIYSAQLFGESLSQFLEEYKM